MSDKEAPKEAETPVETTKAAAVKKKKPLWLKILAGVVVFIVAVIILANIATSGATKASNEFITDIQSQQAAPAYSLLSKEAKAVTPQDQFVVVVNRIGPLLNSKTNMTSKEVKAETGSAATSKVTYVIKGTDGITYKITVNMVKENGEWKVQNFASDAQQ